MYIGNGNQQELEVVDDTTRILHVKHYWNYFKAYNASPRATSRPKSRLAIKQQETVQDLVDVSRFKLPLVNKRSNPIERNKDFVRSKISSQYLNQKKKISTNTSFDLPLRVQKTEVLNKELDNNTDFDYPLPSQYKTKKENLQILEQLTRHLKVFKLKSGKRSVSLYKQEEPQTEEGTFLTNVRNKQNADLIADNSVQQLPDTHTTTEKDQKPPVGKKIYKKTVKSSGVNFPYDLFIMNHSRKKILDHLMNTKAQFLEEGSKVVFDELVKPDKQKMVNIVAQEENKKKKQEFTSRRYMENAVYGLRALNKKSQIQVGKIFQESLPQDSRFYKI